MSIEHSGRVILAATPLGNPADASPRLREALGATAVIAAEDTRRLRRLASDLQVTITGRIISFFEANENSRVPGLLEQLREGNDVLVVTDAGMPSVSDPGYALVAAAIEAGVAVTALPGASAVTTALALSGLPVDRFCFEGFLPRKAGDRRRVLTELAAEPRTCVLFESPRRLGQTLAEMVEVLGAQRRGAVCRELTKTYEEVRRGTLGQLVQWAAGEVRGEITLVLAGAAAAPVAATAGELAARVAELEQQGRSRKEAIAEVAQSSGLPKRAVFDAVVAAKGAPQ